jgi:hypothetical protein
MVAINIQALADTAAQLISDNGRTAALLTLSNTGTDWNPDVTETAAGIKLIQSAFNAMDSEFFTLQKNDVKFLISSDYTPTKQSKIRDGGLDYTIVDFKVIKPGNVTALYIVQARI